MDTKSKSVQRVKKALQDYGLKEVEVVELPESTRTAVAAAEAVKCEVAQIAKSLVFTGKDSGKSVLVITSGANRVDEEIISQDLGEDISMATPDFVREKTSFAIGGVPPIAHFEEPIVYIDEDLLQYQEIWAAAGSPNTVFKLSPDELEKMTGGKILKVV